MRYWLDTEFIEDGKSIDLISIGIVAEDGREYYAVNSECNFENASDWVWKNVLYPIGIYQPLKLINLADPSTSAQTHETVSQAKTRQHIKEDLLLFLAGGQIDPIEDQTVSVDAYKQVEIWGYYADYDWVVFCQLFGTMMDLPEGLPMYCRDLKQWFDMETLNGVFDFQLPKQEEGEHNALYDARWTKKAWEYLVNFIQRRYYASSETSQLEEVRSKQKKVIGAMQTRILDLSESKEILDMTISIRNSIDDLVKLENL